MVGYEEKSLRKYIRNYSKLKNNLNEQEEQIEEIKKNEPNNQYE